MSTLNRAKVYDLVPRLKAKAEASMAQIDVVLVSNRYPEVPIPLYEADKHGFVVKLINYDRGTYFTFRATNKLQAVEVQILPGMYYGMKYYIGTPQQSWRELSALQQPTFTILPGTYAQAHYADKATAINDAILHRLVVDPNRSLGEFDERV